MLNLYYDLWSALFGVDRRPSLTQEQMDEWRLSSPMDQMTDYGVIERWKAWERKCAS